MTFVIDETDDVLAREREGQPNVAFTIEYVVLICYIVALIQFHGVVSQSIINIEGVTIDVNRWSKRRTLWSYAASVGRNKK